MGQATGYNETYAAQPPKAALGPPETVLSLLQNILSTLNGAGSGSGSGFIVVNGAAKFYDWQGFDYYDAGFTNIQFLKYRNGGASGVLVATQSFSYCQNPVTSANASISAISTT